MESKWTPVITEDIIRWIKDYMEENASPNAPIIIGLSGGKDSAVCAALCVKAVGADRVIGISMPDSSKPSPLDDDFTMAKDLAVDLGIRFETFPIEVRDVYESIQRRYGTPNNTVRCNHPSRIRMTTLYAIANQLGGRVCNTSNKSESYVGYDTAWGDQVGDFSPLQDFTATEVIQIGEAAGLSEKYTRRTPSDGMCGQSDEERWGFTYRELDTYLDGHEINPEVEEKIEAKHRAAKFKLKRVILPKYNYHKNGCRDLL